MQEANIGKVHILHVDDDLDVRLPMARSLQEFDHVVLTAGAVAEALQLAKGLKLNLCILDVRLPDGTGIKLCQRLRKLQPDVPIVITPPTQMTRFSGKRSQYAAMPSCRNQSLLPSWNKLLSDCSIEKSKTETRSAFRVRNCAAAITRQNLTDFRNGDRNRSRPNYFK